MSEWPMVKLGELGKWAAGGTPSRLKAEYFGGIIPWASIADLNDGFVSMTEAYSAAGKIHLRQQVEDQKEHAI